MFGRTAVAFALVGCPLLASAFVAPIGRSRFARATGRVSVGEGSSFVKEMKPLEDDDYVAIGLAKCFRAIPDTNKLVEVYVFEPLTAGTLECLAFGVPTSYKRVTAFTVAEVFEGGVQNPQGIKREVLNRLLQGEEADECEDMVTRTTAAARTFKRRVEAQIIAVGDVVDHYNFNVDKKRVLDQKFEPAFNDNVKQHKSIDVYSKIRPEEDNSAEVDRLANA